MFFMSDIQYNAHLHAAIIQQDYDWATVALQFGADCNCVDEDGNTPLHLLVMIGEEQTEAFLALLMKAGANLSLKNKQGLTPLEYAQEYDRWEMALMMASYHIDKANASEEEHNQGARSTTS